MPLTSFKNKSKCSKVRPYIYLKTCDDFTVVERLCVDIEATEEICLENRDHDLLPESEEQGYFDGQKFKQRRIRS